MSWETVIDQVYDLRVKPPIPAATRALRGAAPRDTGDLMANTYAFLSGDSNNQSATIVFVADPAKVAYAPLRGGRKRGRGRGRSGQPIATDHANYTNTRTGWFDRGVAAAVDLWSG